MPAFFFCFLFTDSYSHSKVFTRAFFNVIFMLFYHTSFSQNKTKLYINNKVYEATFQFPITEIAKILAISNKKFHYPLGRSFHISYFTQYATAFYTLANTAYTVISYSHKFLDLKLKIQMQWCGQMC